MKFGTARERSSASKERVGLAFNKDKAAVAAEPKLDPSMTTIKKAELETLQEQAKESEKHKDDLYELNIKYKQLNFQTEQLKRDHKDELEKLEASLNEKHAQTHEDLIKKYSEERNELIRESNKGNDAKFNDLKERYDKLAEEKQANEEKSAAELSELKEQQEKDIENMEQLNQQKFEEMKTQLESLNADMRKTIEEQSEKQVQLAEKIQKQKQRIETLEEEVQAAKIDLEANNIELELMKDEKAELLAEMTENSKVDQEDILNTLSQDEIKQQNRKLRQAVTSIASQFEGEKAKVSKLTQNEEKLRKAIINYEEKLRDMDVLLEEVDRKETELAEMKIENEACLEYETMVEEMAQEILKYEEQIEKLKKENKGLEDILAIQEGYTENLEAYNQELQEEIAEKDVLANRMEQQRTEDEDLLLDVEEENRKYREKLQAQNQAMKDLQEQLSTYQNDTDDKNQIQKLVERQNALVKQVQDNDKQNMQAKIQKIEYHWDNLIKQKVIANIIPKRLKENVHFDSLEKLNTLNKAMQRAMLLFRFICEKQLPNVENQYAGDGEEDVERKVNFVKVMVTVANQAVNLVNAAQRIALILSNMTVDQYVHTTTTFMAWKKFELANEEMGHILDKLRDENLSAFYDTSVFEGFINQILELNVKIEKVFVDKTQQELGASGEKDAKKDDGEKYSLTPAQLERQKTIQNCHKLDIRHQSMRMCVAVIAMQVLIGGVVQGGHNVNRDFVKKAALVYGRLLDIIFKLDHISIEDNGKEYLNVNELNISARITEKYDKIKILWSDTADQYAIHNQDWYSILDAVQKDCLLLLNDYKFKRLIKEIDEEYKDAAFSVDQIFFIDRYKHEGSPWMEITNQIKNEIANFEQLKDTIEKLKAKNKELMKQGITQENSINRNKVTIQSLEKRLAQAQTKIEELNSFRTEAEQNIKMYNSLKKNYENQVKDNEALKKAQEEMVKKHDELVKKAVAESKSTPTEGNEPSQHQQTLGMYRKARAQGTQNRQSKQASFFQELAKTSMLGGGRKMDVAMTPQNMSRAQTGGIAAVNSLEAQRYLQAQEENYVDIIYKLQHDRAQLRAKDITERLNAMYKQEGGLNAYIKQHNENKELKIRLSREKEAQLTKALENVDSLKHSVKMQMASIKVVDLQKKQDFIKRQAEVERQAQLEAKASVFKRHLLSTHNDETVYKPESAKTNANINFMIVQARDEANSAL